jgi:putative membrane protein
MKLFLPLLMMVLPVISMAADNPDQSFFKDAAQAGLAEVADGKMAAEKGSSPAVKQFAAMMVKDHGAANAKLKKIAMSKGIDLPDSPSVAQQAMSAKTKMHSGDAFDKDYIQGQIKAHQDTMDLLQKEIDRGQDADGKAFAQDTLPKVKSHLEKINKIAADAGVKS